MLNPELDSYNYLHINNPKARKQLLAIIEYKKCLILTDKCSLIKKTLAWRKKCPVLKQARLDYILSEPLLSRLQNANYRSDHSSTYITFKI